MSRPVDVLAIGAHPDDVEIGCGGALILAAVAGRRTAVADCTAGERGTHGTPEIRDDERRRAGAILGLSARPCLGLPDGALGADPAHREAVVSLLREHRPRIVLAPYPDDRHPDHAAAGRIVREACFLAGLLAGPARGGRPERVYHYMLHHPFEPSFVVDVAAVWERKMEALRAYTSQFDLAPGAARTPLAGPDFLPFLEARAVYHGAMIGAARGEAFFSAGPMAFSAIPGLDAPLPDPDGPPPYRMYG